MRIHWHWPFARPEEMALARSVVRQGDELHVSVVDRDFAPPSESGAALVVARDLPDVDRGLGSGFRWAASRLGTYRARDRLRSEIWRTGNWDLAHTHYLNRFTDAWTRPDCAFVVSVHDVVPHRYRLPVVMEHALLRRIYGSADALVVHHRRLADELVERFSIAAESIVVVEHQVFPVAARDRSDRPPDATPMVLFFGALRSNKGLEILDRALSERADDEFVLHIAGRGDADVEQLARSMAGRDRRVVAEIGHVSYERKCELFRRSSAVVLPYTAFASQSGVLHDAYGHGRPVIVTDVGALGEAVRQDGGGVVVPPADPGALGRAIHRLVLQGDEWQGHAAAGRAVAGRRTPERLGAQLRSLYDAI